MIYACLTIESDGVRQTYKIIAKNVNAYDEYIKYVNELGWSIIDSFVDDDIGSVVVLPEDFKY